jgi:uncharacterized membrane protein
MSYEPEQEMQDGAAGGETGEPTDGAGYDGTGEDLNAALSGGEMNFVAEVKQPLNKGTLIVVGLLLACGAATYFMYVKSGPSEAMAAADPKAEQTIGQFLGSSQQNVSQMRKMLQDTEKVVTQFRTQAGETQVPLTQLKANPFMREKPRPKADDAAADAARQKAEMVAKATEAVGELRLQTIIHKDPKKASCMINQRLLRKGDKIPVSDGKIIFTIEEIRSDAVTVSIPGVDEKFELRMKQ